MSNTVKKAIAVILCLIMITGTAPLNGLTELDFSGLSSLFSVKAKAADGTCGENLTWEYDESTQTLTISGTGAMEDVVSSNNVPWSSYFSDIKEVIINSGVTNIGNYAFYGCTGLTSITVPNSVTSIGNYAFHECTGLTSITIPDSVTNIGVNPFRGCSGLTSITVSEGNTKYHSAG
ncbi:MAG: leucine-rich repeat domain-containing protein, partial [Clostridia bacterium]|nr:leucine-rich repeat domain-containing protein [Clostridia bacterium]